MCTVLLPLGGYPIAANKYIISYTISYIISHDIISYDIISYHINVLLKSEIRVSFLSKRLSLLFEYLNERLFK